MRVFLDSRLDFGFSVCRPTPPPGKAASSSRWVTEGVGADTLRRCRSGSRGRRRSRVGDSSGDSSDAELRSLSVSPSSSRGSPSQLTTATPVPTVVVLSDGSQLHVLEVQLSCALLRREAAGRLSY